MRISSRIAVAVAFVCIGFMSALCAVPKPATPTPPPQEATSPKSTETVHYITLKFTQSSFTLSLSQHIKDSANTFYVTLPTTKKFYDSVNEGDLLGDKFKTATFLLSGNIGSRKVYVHKKFMKVEFVEGREQK